MSRLRSYLNRAWEEKNSLRFFLSRILLWLGIELPIQLCFDGETNTKIKLDSSTAAHKIYLGKFKPELNKQVFKHFISKGSTVVDVGANIGMYSMLASRLAGNEGNVFSFEPTKESFVSLLKNISVNHSSNVVPVLAAVSEKEGLLDFINNKRSKERNRLLADGVLDETPSTEKVLAMRLDKFLDTAQIERVDFLKIDVEGAELPVIKSLGQKISSVRTIYFECRKDTFKQFGYGERDLFKYLRDRGFVIASPYLKSDLELAWDVLPEEADTKKHAGDLLALNQAFYPKSF